MAHVRRAFECLRPGGVLRTVLPISAELGQSSKHQAFRGWAKDRSRYGRLRFHDLPDGSFAEVGTRVHTVVLTLHR